MKAQHRHELETNTLAKELNVWGEKLRPYTSMLLMAVAAALAFYAVLTMWNSHTASREDHAWFEYEVAMLEGDPDLEKVKQAATSDDLAGSRMQEWAAVTWADRQLRRAADEYLVNRESSEDRLGDVENYYSRLVDNEDHDGAENFEVRNRARFGMARLRELQNRLDDARKDYARVEGPLQPIAAERLKYLEANEKDMSEVVKWLATAELPIPAAPTGPGLPGVRPDFGAAPPSADGAGDPFDPSRSMEDILGGLNGGDGEADRYEEGDAVEGATPGGEGATDETGGAEPAAHEPAADAPAAETEPAGDAAPAEETGAAETEPTDAAAPAGS